MSNREFLFRDGAGIDHHLEDTDEAGTFRLVSSQEAESEILERNKTLATENDGYSPSRELRRVASIPFAVMNHWKATEGWDPYRPDLYPEQWARKLADRDWMHLRTAPGVVGVSNGILR